MLIERVRRSIQDVNAANRSPILDDVVRRVGLSTAERSSNATAPRAPW